MTSGNQDLPDVLRPFKEDPCSHTVRVRLDPIAFLLAVNLAKAEDRPITQWLSRFLVEAINKHFKDESARVRAAQAAQQDDGAKQ